MTGPLAVGNSPQAAPIGAQYVVLVADGTLPNERVLTGTANQIALTDGGAGGAVTLALPQDYDTGATPTLGGLTLTTDLTVARMRQFENGNLYTFERLADSLPLFTINLASGEVIVNYAFSTSTLRAGGTGAVGAPVIRQATYVSGIWFPSSTTMAFGVAGVEILRMSSTGTVQLAEAVDVVLGTATGTKIGSAANQKLGFHGATPVVQQAHIVDADGTLADITAKYNTLLAQLEALGILAAA